MGTLDGQAGYYITAVFTDQGKPASGKHPFTIIITGPDGAELLDVINVVLMSVSDQAYAS